MKKPIDFNILSCYFIAMKRLPKNFLKRYYATQCYLPFVASEPHKIVRCVRCDEAKQLNFHRSGDNELYYVCKSCGFESEPLGLAGAHVS